MPNVAVVDQLAVEPSFKHKILQRRGNLQQLVFVGRLENARGNLARKRVHVGVADGHLRKMKTDWINRLRVGEDIKVSILGDELGNLPQHERRRYQDQTNPGAPFPQAPLDGIGHVGNSVNRCALRPFVNHKSYRSIVLVEFVVARYRSVPSDGGQHLLELGIVAVEFGACFEFDPWSRLLVRIDDHGLVVVHTIIMVGNRHD
mmetsp:Transcript_13314/g.29281  ORF Transcript_13314/g.29281 Transcript_13314/m.29281 type:complete len:203 (-) Transcript_13314:104-712(-)